MLLMLAALLGCDPEDTDTTPTTTLPVMNTHVVTCPVENGGDQYVDVVPVASLFTVMRCDEYEFDNGTGNPRIEARCHPATFESDWYTLPADGRLVVSCDTGQRGHSFEFRWIDVTPGEVTEQVAE
jgi:hypothetical protein